MPRVECPECDERVKVPDGYEKSFIRCPACDAKIPLVQVRNKTTEPKSSGMSGCLAIIGYTLAFVGAMVCVGVAFLSPGVAILLGVVTGLAVSIYAGLGVMFLWFSNLMKRFGERLRICAPWLGLQVFGFIILISPIVLHSIAKNAGWFDRAPPDGGGIVPGPIANDPLFGMKAPPAVDPLPNLPLTGDAALDKKLADLADANGKAFKPAIDSIIATPPNQHRAIVAQHLAAQLKTAPVHARPALTRALGIWGTPQETQVLIAMLNDADINSRNDALQALGKLKDQRAAGPMAKSVLEVATRFHAEESLKAMGPIAEKEVRALLTQPDISVQVIAIRILGDIGTEQSIPDLQAAAKGPLPLQTPAQKALAAINSRAKK